jgi:hypothetical protein
MAPMNRSLSVLLLAVALASAWPVALSAEEVGVTNPLFRGADPHAIVVGNTFWLYPTFSPRGAEEFHAFSSTNLSDWQRHGPVLQFQDVSWIKADGQPRHGAWAPGVMERGGRYYFYYSVGPQDVTPSRIGVAVGEHPAGPFKDSGKPLLTGGNGFEAIDAMVFPDATSGQAYLYAGGSAGAKLRVFELNADLVSFARELAVATPPQFTEGAFVHERNGIYYLSYSHGGWRDSSYSVHYATASSPTGPWEYRGAILTSDARHKGPGHHAIVRAPLTGDWLIFYHRWNNAAGDSPYRGARQVCVDRLEYDSAGLLKPVVMTDGWKLSPRPPGVVIDHSPAATGLFIGSPSLTVLTNGDYLAAHDFFGPKSDEFGRPATVVFRSTDRGQTWQQTARLQGAFWSGLFVHRGAAYLMGTDQHHGRIVIRRSTDGGATWTEPRDTTTGLLTPPGQYHTAPMPVIEHGGRLWRAFEDAMGGTEWGKRYRAGMLSVPVDADLLCATNWTLSNFLPRDSNWLHGNFNAWLEGNAVVAPDGGLVDILRVDTPGLPEQAALVNVSADGRSASFAPATGFVDFPGGAKKFTIRQDPRGGGYWSLATLVPEPFASAGRPGGVRNTLALVHSPDLRRWEIRCVLLHHPDVAKHGFQYVDWQFEGDDLIAVCRTAFDDAAGGARNNHDANFLTFHRWERFRALTPANSVAVTAPPVTELDVGDLRLTGRGFVLANLTNGAKAFSNRAYVWQDVPPALAGGSFIRLDGGGGAELRVRPKHDTTLRMATAPSQARINLAGWRAVAGAEFGYNDDARTRLQVFERQVRAGEEVAVPQGNWCGGVLLLPRAAEEPPGAPTPASRP